MKKIVIIAIALSMMLGCKDTKKMEKQEDYHYGATVTSVLDYPIEVHTGYLATKKAFITGFSNAGIEQSGWDVDGGSMGAGGKIIPSLLSLTWVSYAEKTFWKLEESSLPSDVILAYFKKGFYAEKYINYKKSYVHDTYNHITVAVAPGGVVVVFLTADSQRVEIARLQAEKTFVDVNDFSDNPANHTQQQFFDHSYNVCISDKLKEKIKKEGIPLGLWDKYRKRYNYRFVTKLYKPTAKERFDRQIKYLNGEEEILQEGCLDKYFQKAIPYTVEFFYEDDKLQWGEATFDDQEMMEVFETLSKKHPNEPIDIISKVGFEYRSLSFTVVCGDDSIDLKKFKLGNMSGIMK